MNPQDLQMQIDKLNHELLDIKSTVYANNFSSSQDFNKYSRFNTRLKVPKYSVDPSTCEVGEIIEVSGKLKVCSAANTWTIVGTQT